MHIITVAGSVTDIEKGAFQLVVGLKKEKEREGEEEEKEEEDKEDKGRKKQREG